MFKSKKLMRIGRNPVVAQFVPMAMLGLIAFSPIFIMASCKNSAAKTAVDAADAACVWIEGESDEGTATKICATEHELSPFVHMIVGQRKAAAAHASACGLSSSGPCATSSASSSAPPK